MATDAHSATVTEEVRIEICNVCFNLQYSPQRENQLLKLPARVGYKSTRTTRHFGDFEASSTCGCHICAFITKTALHFGLGTEEGETIVITINSNNEAALLFPLSYTTIQVYTPTGKNTPTSSQITETTVPDLTRV